jgi:amino acid transporter
MNNKEKKVKRITLIADIILIVILILIFIYVYKEIEAFKLLGRDVCRLCELQTNASCIKFGYG